MSANQRRTETCSVYGEVGVYDNCFITNLPLSFLWKNF